MLPPTEPDIQRFQRRQEDQAIIVGTAQPVFSGYIPPLPTPGLAEWWRELSCTDGDGDPHRKPGNLSFQHPIKTDIYSITGFLLVLLEMPSVLVYIDGSGKPRRRRNKNYMVGMDSQD